MHRKLFGILSMKRRLPTRLIYVPAMSFSPRLTCFGVRQIKPVGIWAPIYLAMAAATMSFTSRIFLG